MAADSKDVYLERFIDILFALIVGFSVHIFSESFQPIGFSLALEDFAQTCLFFSAVAVLVYDWIAYHLLIEKFPYHLDRYFLRFFIDLAIYYSMYLLFIAVGTHLLAYLLLLSLWFFLVFCWHLCAYFQVKSEPLEKQQELVRISLTGMGSLLLFCASTLLIALQLLPWVIREQLLSAAVIELAVGITIILFCVLRFIYLVKPDE